MGEAVAAADERGTCHVADAEQEREQLEIKAVAPVVGHFRAWIGRGTQTASRRRSAGQ